MGSFRFITTLHTGEGSTGTPNLYYVINGDTVPKKSQSSSEPIRRLICNKWRIGDISCIALGELQGAASSSRAAFAFFLNGLLIYGRGCLSQKI